MASSLISTAEQLVSKAMQHGAEFADVIVLGNESVTSEYRLGKKENIERSESAALGLRTVIGKRASVVSASDIRPHQFEELASRCVSMTKETPEDPYLCITDEASYAKSFDDLELYDSHAPDIAWLDEQAEQVEAAAMTVEGITNSEGGSASHGSSDVVLVTSRGFSHQYRSSMNSISVCVLAGEGTAMERDYDYSSKRFVADLASASSIGKKAAEKTLKRLGAKRAKTGSYPVVFANDISNSLVGYFTSAINGASICQNTSFLKDCMGKKIFSDAIHITDDPFIKRGHGSRNCDAEGVMPKKLNLVENGVLQSWILDLRSAHKLGLETTGHANRGVSSNPSPSSSNVTLANGTLSFEELISDIKQGFFVTDTFGMGVNLVTGDYSQGANGFWIENGEICFPVNEVTIAGRLQDMFLQMTAANDIEFKTSRNAPSLRIESMTVAGE